MLEIKLLGQFEVRRDGHRLTIPTRNAQSLFAYLVLKPDQVHRRERLAGLLWPDSSEENARSNLRHELWRLRKALEVEGKSCFLINDLTIAFHPQGEHTLDVQMLEGVSLDGSTAEDLMKALSVYQGELLPGFYDEWIFAERTRLFEVFEVRITRLLEILENEGRWAEVLEWGARWIAMGQWPEPAYRALVTAYAVSGDVSKAVATYERFSKGLQKDLGVKPSEQTQDLYKNLKAGRKIETKIKPLTPGPRLPKPDMEYAQPTYSLPKMRRSNLPKPLTSFIGREKEIQQVGQLASSARLVTITGSGGVGKTRLAIQVASALAPQYTDGTWWVELAPLFYTSILGKSNDPQQPGGLQNVNHRNLQVPLQEHSKVDLVTQAVAKVLRVPDVPGQPELEGIVELLHDKKTLLVLDNCEHLVDECAFLVQRLLADCPELTFLTTSREALGVPGERPWLLPSLSLPERKLTPETDALFQSEAVKLFVERTADVMPGYEPDKLDASIIAQICLRLDGIPLAIELAAARMSMLSAQEIANRLDHRFSLLTGGQRTALPRHKTLRAAIEWSYELLSKSEQILFRRLSIFSGSFTLEAAEAICTSQEIHDDEVLSLLGRLVDKSLVIVDPAPYGSGQPSRYRYLDTIHGFGQLKLDEAVETRWMRDRHAGYYVHLVEIAEPELLLKNQNYWYNLLRAENDNIRAAVEWSAESNQSEAGLRLVGALSWFYFRSGSTREGIDLVQKALTLPSAYQFKEARARALNFAGFLHYLIGEPEMARRSLVEAQSIFRELGDEASLAWSLQFMGLVLAFEKEYDLADAAFEEGLAYTRKLGNQLANTFLHFHGDIDLEKGDISRAKRIYEESANYLRNIGNKSFLAYPLRRLGYLALQQNDLRTASRYFLESLEYNRETGDMPGLTASLVSLAALATHQDRPVIAACLYGNVENRLESVSANLLHLDRAELVRIRSALPAYLDQAAFTAIFTEGWKMSEIQAIQYAETTFAGDD